MIQFYPKLETHGNSFFTYRSRFCHANALRGNCHYLSLLRVYLWGKRSADGHCMLDSLVFQFTYLFKLPRHWMLLISGTGNGEPGTGVWERVYSGNPPENSKWRTKRPFQTLILSLGRVDDWLLFKYCLGEATKPSIPW